MIQPPSRASGIVNPPFPPVKEEISKTDMPHQNAHRKLYRLMHSAQKRFRTPSSMNWLVEQQMTIEKTHSRSRPHAEPRKVVTASEGRPRRAAFPMRSTPFHASDDLISEI